MATKTEGLYKIFDSNIGEFWELLESEGCSFSPEFKDLITKMLLLIPSDRPTIDEIKNHPWF